MIELCDSFSFTYYLCAGDFANDLLVSMCRNRLYVINFLLNHFKIFFFIFSFLNVKIVMFPRCTSELFCAAVEVKFEGRSNFRIKRIINF